MKFKDANINEFELRKIILNLLSDSGFEGIEDIPNDIADTAVNTWGLSSEYHNSFKLIVSKMLREEVINLLKRKGVLDIRKNLYAFPV